MLYYDLMVYSKKNTNNNFKFLFYGEGAFAETFLSFKNTNKIAYKNKLCLIWGLRKYVKQNKIDLVHCHTPYGLVYIFFATLLLPVERILTVHGSKNNTRSKLIYIISFILSHRVLFVSSSFKERMKSALGLKENKKFKVLQNGINVEKFPQFSDSIKSANRPIALGMVGNFYNDGRDQLTVCKGTKLLKKKGLEFSLYFAGGARKEKSYFLDSCVSYVKVNDLTDSVKFLGFQDDVYSLLNEWDVFVYSSNRDTFGIAVVEAMMAGIPVIVNDLDVFVEITENGKYGTLYKSKDPNDLAARIEAYLKNPKPFHEKAELAAVYAREKFSIEKHVKQLHKIYQGLMHA